MYRAFNLTNYKFNRSFIDEGAASFFTNKNIVEKSLSDFLTNGKIDGSKISGHWFPQIKTDVFISHSHTDQTEAKNLAGFLKNEFGLSSFIDSCVWGYGDDLLKQIDNEYCRNSDRDIYSYEKRNGTTAHVHMMLSTALGQILNLAECVIFMNTPNSISSSDASARTLSPWIYYEIGLLKIIKQLLPERKQKEKRMENFTKEAEAAQIEHSIDLSVLIPIQVEDLNNWSKKWSTAKITGKHPLDVLYGVASAGK